MLPPIPDKPSTCCVCGKPARYVTCSHVTIFRMDGREVGEETFTHCYCRDHAEVDDTKPTN